MGGGDSVRGATRLGRSSESSEGARWRGRRQKKSSSVYPESVSGKDARLHRLRVHDARTPAADTRSGGADSVRVGATCRRCAFCGEYLDSLNETFSYSRFFFPCSVWMK